MATKFIVKKWWAENRTTRNAFYQAMAIYPENQTGPGHHPSVQVLHYGSNKASEGEFSRPVRGGNIKFTMLANPRAALAGCRNKISEKKKGGYSESLREADIEITGADNFRKWVSETFGANTSDTLAMLRHFGIDTTVAVTDDPVEDEHYPSLAVEDSPPEWEDARGTW